MTHINTIVGCRRWLLISAFEYPINLDKSVVRGLTSAICIFERLLYWQIFHVGIHSGHWCLFSGAVIVCDCGIWPRLIGLSWTLALGIKGPRASCSYRLAVAEVRLEQRPRWTTAITQLSIPQIQLCGCCFGSGANIHLRICVSY
jgi:hypothetical protein